MRLDRALHVRGLARSRSHAQQLIDAGVVSVAGRTLLKASTTVTDDIAIVIDESEAHYVSRAAHKLLGALDVCEPLGLKVAGASALDAGASTGGFTQVLLERSVARVLAVDVGHGQLVPEIAQDPRVDAREGINVRDLTASSEGAGVDLVVADLSFISLTHVIAPLADFAGPASDFVLMVKPQFEVGRSKLSSRGVVTDPRDRVAAVTQVANEMRAQGLSLHHIARSQLPGPQGNHEFFVWGSQAWQASDSRGGTRPVLNDIDLKVQIKQEVKAGT
ncbi:TlyA family RNA methyltransferase [Demequina flava]|uniref:TlyA family RNA methyltransferase n=1 Tax=Demequina flava TaxID=1095025 RepID=UPI000785EEF3|nr:TlyA family RNA methyltransferase [Demequina flava]